MTTMTLEQLLQREPDSTLIDIYHELASCVIPATGYAHAYCRKINKLINAGELQTVPDKYRNVYLPTLSKMIFKEMSRRYASYCCNCKAPEVEDLFDEEESEDLAICQWCGIVHDKSDLRNTDIGMLCDQCITAIRSRGEHVTLYD